MASNRRQTHHRPTISPIGPHLLKIIPKGTCKQDILKLPKTFLRKCGDDLSYSVVLKLPSGSEWKVELRRWDDGVCFGKGWQKFFDFYSLGNCHSLVFQYEGNSKFRVCILNRNLTEIDYPLTNSEMSETDEDDGSDGNASEESSSGDDSVEIFDDSRSWSGTKKSPLPSARPCNINRRSLSDKVHFRAKRHSECTSSTPRFRKQVQCRRINRPWVRGHATALQRAEAYKSENPSFLVPMTHSYITNNFLWLPSGFSNHMKRLSNNSGDILLRVLDGRSWSVVLRYENPGRSKSRFQHGWHKFVRGNNLEVGDVCVFVLIDEFRLTFEVVIFRAIEAANTLSPQDSDGEEEMHRMEETDEHDDSVEISDDVAPCSKRRKKSTVVPLLHKKKTKVFGCSSRTQILLSQKPEVRIMLNQVTERGKHRALQIAKAFKSEYPCFTVVMCPSYILAHHMVLEADFVKEHLVNRAHNNVILRVPDGKTWPVKLGSQKQVKFQAGWMTFVEDNQLHIGDVCFFVLVNDIKLLMDVVIFRASRASSSRTQKLLKRRPEITLSGKDRALQRAKAFKSEWPSCTVVMQSSYIGVRAYLSLGARFTKKHLLNRQGDTVILRVDGRTWTVQLWKHDKLIRFNSGWNPFVQDNHLEIGDVCVFVLVNEIKLLMDVILFRAGEAAECTLSPGNRHSRSVQVENVQDELDVDGEMEADQYLTVDTTSESE